MTNSFYNSTGEPGTGAFAASAPMRSEFNDIEDGFDKMPQLTAGTAVVVNGAGTALSNTVGRLALAGNFTTTGAFAVTLAASAAVVLTLPAVDGTLATLAGTETFSNKTFGANNNVGTPTALVGTNITGTAAGLTAGSVTTIPNLSGAISSVGNVTTITSQTGTGTKFVVDTSPTLVTPVLGVATATSINKVAITAPATSATLTIADGKTLTASATLTLTGTDGKTLTLSNSMTLAGTDATVQTFPSTSATIARTDAAQTFTGVQTFSTPIAVGSVATMSATVGGGVPTPPNNTTAFLRGDGTFAVPPTGTGTVTTVSVTTANGVSGSVANPTTTPAITLTLGAITPTTVNGNTVPTATDTVALIAATQTLSAKTLASPIVTGTMTLPDGTSTITSAGILLGTTSNLQFSSGTNLSRIGGGILGVGTGAQGSVAGEFRAALLTVGSNIVVGTTPANSPPAVAIWGGRGNPATTGSAVDGILRAGYTGGSYALDFGVSNVPATNTGWIQSRSPGNYATNNDLWLNPNGGNVSVGTTTTQSQTLYVAGTFATTGALTYGGVTLTNAVTGTGPMVLGTSPTLTTAVLGSSTATTQTAADNSTKVATTAYADASSAAVVANGRVRAWVNWTGGGTSINGQGNVASITRNGTGDYTVTFTASIPANAAWMPSFLDAVNTGGIKLSVLGTASVRVLSFNVAGGAQEFTTYSLAMVA